MDTKTGLNGLKKYKTISCILIQRIAKRRKIAIRGTYVISFPRPSYALTLCVSNKNGKAWNFRASSWIRTEKPSQYFVEITENPHSSFLSRYWSRARVNVVAWDEWHFDNKLPRLWFDKCSLKEGFDLTWERIMALWGFEVSVATKYD